MAIDPRVLSALSAGAKTSGTYTPGEYTGPQSGGAWNLGQSIIDILSTGGYATAGLTNKIGQNVAAIQRGELGGALDLINPLSASGALAKGVVDRRTYSQNLKEMGVEDNTATWLGLALDIGLDPTTYITGGTLAGVKGAVQVGKGVSKLSSSQKTGNLLSNLATGYQKGRANYKVTTAERKLNRVRKEPAIAKAEEKLAKRTAKAESIITPVEVTAGLPKKGSAASRVATEASEKGLSIVPELIREAQGAAKTPVEEAVQAETKAGKAQAEAKAKASESPDEARVDIQQNKEALVEQSKVNKNLNEYVQNLTKPGVGTEYFEKFTQTKNTFLQKASNVLPEEAAGIKVASGEAAQITAKEFNRYAKTGIAAGSKAKLYDKLMDAEIVVPPNSQILETYLAGAGRTADALSAAITDPKAPTRLVEQAIAAFEATKKSLQVGEVINPKNRAWVEGIVSADDAGDAARGLVESIYPTLRKGSPLSYKAITQAIGKALEKRLKAAGPAGLSAEQVEQVIAKFISDDLAKVVNGIKEADVAKLAGAGNTYADLGEFVAALQSGAAKVSPDMKRDLAKILGLRSNASAAKIIEMVNKVDTGLLHVLDGAETTTAAPGAAKLEDAVVAAGDAAPAGVAAKLDEALQGDINNVDAAVNVFAEEAAGRFQSFMADVPADVQNKFLTAVFNLLKSKKGLFYKEREQIAELAAKAGFESADDMFAKIQEDGITVVTNIAKQFNVDGAVRLDEVGSEGAIDLFTEILDLNLYKSGDLAGIAKNEYQLLTAVTELLRAIGIPVRSTETAASAILRAGEDAIPLYSSVTWADFMELMNRSGQTKLIGELRKVRGPKKNSGEYKLGNFLPTQLQAAWLRAADIFRGLEPEELAALTKESEEWLAIRKTLDNRVLTNGKLETAFHVKLAEKLPKFAKEIDRVSDEFIEFLRTNYRELSDLHAGREALIAASYGSAARSRVANIYSRLIQYAAKIEDFKADARASRDGSLTSEAISEAFDANMQTIMKDIASLLTEIKSSYGNPQMGQYMYGVVKSLFLNPAPRGGMAETNAVVKNLWREMDAIVGVDAAMAAAAKSIPKNARNAPKATSKIAGERTKAMGKKTDQEEAIKKGATADNAVPGAEVIADVSQANSGLIEALAKKQGFFRELAIAFRPSYIMGPLVKTLLNAREHRAFSWFQLNIKVIDEYKKLYRGREAELLAAFKTLQKFKSEAANTAEDLVLRDWMREVGERGDIALIEDLDLLMSNLFGSDTVFGLVKANAILPSELAAELGKLGIGGDVTTFLKSAEDVDIETFWHSIDMTSKNPLDVVSATMMAVSKVGANIELGNRFNRYMGRTVDELAAAGEDLAVETSPWVRLDAESSGFIGRIIGDTDKLFHVDDLKALGAAERFLTDAEKMSTGTLNSIIDIADRVTYVLKASQTLLRPGHWVVSTVGEAAMNLLAGVGLRHYHKANRILSKFDPKNFDDKEEAFKNLAVLNATKGKRINEGEFIDVYWTNPATKKREQLTDEIVHDLAVRYGILMVPGGGLEDFIVSSQGLDSKIYGTIHKGINKLTPLAALRDNSFRLPHFIQELERVSGAKTLDEAAALAAAEVHKWHPTAANLTAFEKKVARRLVYFYTWQRTALTTVIGKLLEVPGVGTIPNKIQYAFADQAGFDPDSFGDPWDADGMYASWYTGQLWGPQFNSPLGGYFGDVVGAQVAIQPIDVLGQIAKPFTVQPGQNPLEGLIEGTQDLMGSNLGPVWKSIIEASAQSRLGPGGDLPSAPEYILNQIGTVNTWSKISGLGQDPNPYETTQEKSEKDARLLWNWILGQRITDYNTPASQYKWTMDQQEMMRRMAGQ